MKGLKKIALVSAIAAASAGAQAELKALDDSAMGELTGQAGLTIDIESKVSIGQFMYKDAGSLFINDIKIGGNQNLTDDPNNLANNTDMLDNIRMNIDIAGSAATGENILDRGLSDFYGAEGLAALALAYGAVDDGRLAGLAGGIEANAGGASLTQLEANNVQFDPVNAPGVSVVQAIATATGGTFVKGRVGIEDGDLLIHEIATDPLAALVSADDLIAGGATALSGYTTQQVIDAAVSAVDFKYEIGAIGIAESSYQEGADLTTAQTTTLISDLSIAGYLGHKDIHIENNGNGFGATDTDGNGRISNAEATDVATGSTGYGDANSKIHMDSYFNITDLDVYIDIAGVQINDLKIHNHRGDTSGLDGLNAFGFAHSMRDIYAVKDAVLDLGSVALNPAGQVFQGTNTREGYVDGIAINTTSKFDLDIGSLSFGDTGTSIGKIYLTDVTNTTNWTISAH
ncbi:MULTISPECIES: DUF6160 family protein [unclassified Oleiphilus]|uniref:DUF6160 family protein n=2 Tax=Oleiphilus TaxID=141450 RepID=UPI0007C2D6BA|nr:MULTISPECIES: DUF6160 family protein [unclassified Oleiphilus]KZZ38443.1 hypothetical protein A3757_07950 [Oleiphilus sp. HI0117]KZZ53128.1 hypothetical protein A3761_18060 [Oleiphilus sp. HI0123]